MKFYENLIHRIKNFLISLRVGMSVVFISIFLIISIAIVIFSSFSFHKALNFLATDLLTSTTTAISRELSTLLSQTMPITKLSTLMIEDKTVDPNNFPEIIKYTRDILKLLPQSRIVHWGDETGDFVYSERQKNNIFDSYYFNFKQHKTTPVTSQNFINNTFFTNIINQQKYDPRTRPWYITAKAMGEPTWTNLYTLQHENVQVISSTAPAYLRNKFFGAFSIEITLEELSKFLSEHPISRNSFSFIINNEGKLLIYPKLPYKSIFYENSTPIDINQFTNTPLSLAYQIFSTTQKNKFSFNYHHKNYLASFTPISQFSEYHWYIGIIVPIDYFIGKLKHFNTLIMILLSITFIICLQLISFFSKKISIPVNKLARELEEIKFFRIQPLPKIQTYIKEIYTMSHAIESMKVGLDSFKKYVPENLVRQLIFTGEAAKIGGTSRNIAIFFSDIINFASIAEKMGSEEMMKTLCAYFDEITHIIAKYNGTVDKYIGDSVMAFWGAPLYDDNSVQHACKTALECQERLKFLSREAKRYAFPTRIGIHFGKAIVGNLGSFERLNYTAIGEAVNIANQLEQINKFYGTRIVVSEFVREQVSDQFIFRILDRIVVKGKKGSIYIYELLKTKENADDRLIEFCELYHKAFTAYQQQNWYVAIQLFENVNQIKPDDFATHIMINRCRSFQEKPPFKNWDGTWIYTSKNNNFRNNR